VPPVPFPRGPTLTTHHRPPMAPISIQPTTQRVVLQHTAALKTSASQLKHPLRSARSRLQQRSAMPRTAQRSQALRDTAAYEDGNPSMAVGSEGQMQVSQHNVMRALRDAYRSEPSGRALTGGRQNAGAPDIDTRLAAFQEERLRGRSAELFQAVHAPRPAPLTPLMPGAAEGTSLRRMPLVSDAVQRAMPDDGAADLTGIDACGMTFRAFAVDGDSGSPLGAPLEGGTQPQTAVAALPSASPAMGQMIRPTSSPSRAARHRPTPKADSPSVKIWAPQLEPPLAPPAVRASGGSSPIGTGTGTGGGANGASCMGRLAGLDFD